MPRSLFQVTALAGSALLVLGILPAGNVLQGELVVTPADSLTTSLTPRRTQRFKARPGDAFQWTSTLLGDGRELQTSRATADAHGLVTIDRVAVTAGKSR